MIKNDKLPKYYIGKYKKIKAYDVINDYELTYNVGTACTYLLRSGKKDGNPAEQDIAKAINHLKFELERIELKKAQDKIDKVNNEFFNNENSTITY